ncbi:MAG: Glu-tRNA(Gln) amidotransferase subunit GatD [Candidatus Altiarchaeia archaeon]
MDSKVRPGNKVVVDTKEGKYSGIVMERPELADKDHIVIKLENGYNVGIGIDKITGIQVIERGIKQEEYKPGKHVTDPGKPTISVLATGGTIASRVDYLTGGVHSAFTAEELVSAVPELEEIANIRVKQVFNKFSENIAPSDWVKIAQETYNEIKKGADGIVITHGTDTMHYTSAALSFMLKTPVPVVITGAQRSSDRGSSDAAMNLIDAAVAASHGKFAEVAIVMHAESSDTKTYIHPGTKARKMHTSRRDAFKTVNGEPIGTVENRMITYTRRKNKPLGGECVLDAKLEEKVFLLKCHPGLAPQAIDNLVRMGYRGILLEGTGLGHTSDSLFDSIKKAAEAGVAIAMASQTLYGRVDMNVYSTGRRLLDMGVIPCEDMSAETAYVKLMWVLGHTNDLLQVRDMMLSNCAGEISDRTLIE